MELNITCIPGDGIGPEIVAEAKKVLDVLAKKYGHKINYTDILMGGASIDAYGVPLTEEAVQTAKNADAVLMGSIGGDTTTSPWYKLPPHLRPEAGLLSIRKALNLFANLRPAVLYEELAEACPLKKAGSFTSCIAQLSTSICSNVTSGYPAATSSTTFLHNLEESSTLALSTLVTFFFLFIAISNPLTAIRRISVSSYVSVSIAFLIPFSSTVLRSPKYSPPVSSRMISMSNPAAEISFLSGQASASSS